MAKLGVFCIENWSGKLANRAAVLPVLEFLDRSGAIRTIPQRISSPDELRRYFTSWKDRNSYPVGYLALHGSPGSVRVGSKSIHYRRQPRRRDSGRFSDPDATWGHRSAVSTRKAAGSTATASTPQRVPAPIVRSRGKSRRREAPSATTPPPCST